MKERYEVRPKNVFVQNYVLVTVHLTALLFLCGGFHDRGVWMHLPLLSVTALGLFCCIFQLDVFSSPFWKTFFIFWLVWAGVMMHAVIGFLPQQLLPLAWCAIISVCIPMTRLLFRYAYLRRAFVRG